MTTLNIKGLTQKEIEIVRTLKTMRADVAAHTEAKKQIKKIWVRGGLLSII